jgi:hypothetical protein
MNDRPWMTALERQFAALRFATDGHHGDGSLHGQNRPRRIAALKRADAFAWSPEISAAVLLASRTIPIDSVLSQASLPGNGTCWFWFGDSLRINPYPGGDKTICAILFAPFIASGDDPAGLEVTILVETDDERRIPYPVTSWIWPWNKPIAEIDPGYMLVPGTIYAEKVKASRSAVYEASRFIMASSVWLSQRVISVASGPIERHRKKQLAREYDVPIPSDVKVIQLRRSEHQPLTDSSVSDATVEWSCRWLVGGHWRNQPYANGEHKLIYIMPYVKGPEDKPLKVPTHTVYSVSR